MTTQKNGFLGLGGLFRNIKNMIMTDFIVKFLAQILEKMKAKNPKVWGALASIATGLQFGFDGLIEVALNGFGFNIDLPSGFLSLDWILAHTPLVLADRYTDWIMWILIMFTGSKAAAYLPKEKRDVALEKQADVIKEVDKREQRQLERAERKAARKAD